MRNSVETLTPCSRCDSPSSGLVICQLSSSGFLFTAPLSALGWNVMLRPSISVAKVALAWKMTTSSLQVMPVTVYSTKTSASGENPSGISVIFS